jgi:hypothetical protein
MTTVMDALSTALLTTTLDRSQAWPADSVEPPCGVVTYPNDMSDTAFISDKLTAVFPVYVVLGTATSQSARTALSALLPPCRAALNAVRGGGIDSTFVQTAKIRVVNIAGVDYLAAVFDCEVIF